MRIAIIGTGRVGAALGKGWTVAGHHVVYGSRRPAQVDCAVGTADTIAGAARQSEVVVLATPFNAVTEAIAAAGDMSGKVVIDATNPMGAAFGAQVVAAAAGPAARVVKAFNTMGFETMADPLVEGRPALCLVAGDDAEAKATALQLARHLGFEAVDTGGLETARLLENLAELWLQLALCAGQGRHIAFALLRRS